ncbi:MAG TPA: cell division protein FtsA [Candidatus Limnocylindria bacterium]|jgi:cell division protein FtsA|nr:cell division protein FtsA [Candidatus Limnocylindria bacterium]
MAEQPVLVAIDIGTTKVCVLIGETTARGTIDVIGIGQAPSDGLRKGVVIDIDRTVQSIASAVDAAERLSGLKVRSAFVGISGSHIGSQNSRGMVAVSGSSRHDVDRPDTIRAIEAARAVSIPNTREILHVIPRGYVVDGQEGVRDPIGMSAVRLEVETHIVTASTTSVQNLTKCVQRAGVEIDELVLAQLATAEATLNEEDRELGVCLADVGGDTTDVAIFQDGSIAHCATIPMGGRSVTADLGIILRVTPDVAESVKFRYGSAVPLEVDPDEVLQVTSIGEDVSHGVTRRYIAEIVESRVSEIFKFIGAEIEAAGATNRLQAGLVLTGGGSQLTGVTRSARDQLGMSARVVGPTGLGGLTDQISTPPYAAASGLLLWGARNWPSEDERASARALEGVTTRIGKIFKGLMP